VTCRCFRRAPRHWPHPGRCSAEAGRLALLRGDVAQAFLEGGDHAEPYIWRASCRPVGFEVLCAATAGGLAVLRVRCVDGETPESGARGGAPGVGSASPVAFHAGRVLFAGFDTR
jgi:hypothetical protein